MTSAPVDSEGRVAEIARGLTKAQRAWFSRGFIRIGNPIRHVPRIHPMALDRTWDALKRRGLLEHGRFGQMLTPLGLAVREHLLAEPGEGEGR